MTAMRDAPWMAANPPWHMWGTTERIALVIPVTGQRVEATQQITKVEYKRPDSWHFLFSLKLLSCQPPIGDSLTSVSVFFDVTVGLGRASVTLPAFCVLTQTWDVTDPAPLNVAAWCTSVSAGARFPGDTAPNLVEHVVSQDIQVQARCRLISSTPQNVQIEVGSFWSPKTHVRPDWMLLDVAREEQFAGMEIRGQ